MCASSSLRAAKISNFGYSPLHRQHLDYAGSEIEKRKLDKLRGMLGLPPTTPGAAPPPSGL